MKVVADRHFKRKAVASQHFKRKAVAGRYFRRKAVGGPRGWMERIMNEAEWLACTDPDPMLEFLRGKAGERKLRLLACACCRRIPCFFESQPDRQGLELTECDVDGLAEEEDFAALPEDVWDIRWYRRDGWNALDRAMNSYCSYVWDSRNLHATTEQVQAQARRQSDADLAVLVFDIFGNPFRSVSLDPAWLMWDDSLVVRLAQAAYDERELPEGTLDNGRLAVLADALEDAGCQDQNILGHCRSGGEHVRGCWVIDLVLGKS
jgi:hypothetical protein